MAKNYRLKILEKRGDGVALTEDKAKIIIEDGSKKFKLKKNKKIIPLPSAGAYWEKAYHYIKDNDALIEMSIDMDVRKYIPHYNPTMMALYPSTVSAIYRNTANPNESWFNKYGNLIGLIIVAIAIAIIMQVSLNYMKGLTGANQQEASALGAAATALGHIAVQLQNLVQSGALNPINTNNSISNQTHVPPSP